MVLRNRANRTKRWVVLGLGWMVSMVVSTQVQAQVRQPGAHVRYRVEVEPQLALSWAGLPGKAAGIGPGVRVTVPVLQDGPLAKLNNSLALGAGANWGLFQESCGTYFWQGPMVQPGDPAYSTYVRNCSAHQFTIPLILQWNFFLTPVLSVFAEPGMALVHQRRSGTGWCDGQPCSTKDDATTLPFVMWVGGRLAMSERLALTIRLGSPYVSTGLSLLF